MAENNPESGPRPLVTVGGRPIDLSLRSQVSQAVPDPASLPPVSVEIASPENQPPTLAQAERRRQQQVLALVVGLVALGVALGLAVAAVWWRRRK